MKSKNIFYITLFIIIFIGVLKIPRSQKYTVAEYFKKISYKNIDLSQSPTNLLIGNKEVRADLTINYKLQNFIKSEIQKFRPEHVSVVVIENGSGKILSGVGYSKFDEKFHDELVFSSTNPSASLFKIITAADLIENGHVETKENFNFVGRATTLYKFQIFKERRYQGRTITFEEAFAKSNNVVFAKAALEHSNEKRIFQMAGKFGFNSELMKDIDLDNSIFHEPSGDYNLAESASGFNKDTMISPIHGAVFSGVVANNGILVRPRLFEKIYDLKQQELLNLQSTNEQIITAKSASTLRDMMILTIEKGTARKSFKGLRKSLKEGVIIGGKTGSITGGLPFGKRDWFTSFVVPRNAVNPGISICVMIVNDKKWVIRSSFLARRIVEFYYSNIDLLALKKSIQKNKIGSYGNQRRHYKKS